MQGITLHPQLPGSIRLKEEGAQAAHSHPDMEVLKLHLSLLLMSFKSLPAWPSSHPRFATFIYINSLKVSVKLHFLPK